MRHVLPLMALSAILASEASGQLNRESLPDSGYQPAGVTADSAHADSVRLLLLPGRAGRQAPSTDAWGVEKNGALAVGEVLLINGIVWMYNEYPRGAEFTQINPRSWYENIKGGWTYDDNHFANNQLAHPFHGSLYYSAARTSGFNFWESAPFAFMGSGFWECCGETHPPAINDWLSTSNVGISIGEAMYRISSTVLDNTATGSERTWREIGGFLLNPVRGFNRLVSGRMREVHPNPEDPLDRIPERLLNTLFIGSRRVLDQGALESDTSFTATFQVNFQFGDPFAEGRRKPFDFFTFGAEFNTREKTGLSAAQIRGNLWATDLRRTENNQLVFGVVQDFDYFNNNAMEFGGQSVGAFLLSRWPLSRKFSLGAQLTADAQILGAVNSEFSFLAVVPDTSRLREYDFGVGGGGRAGLHLSWNGRNFIDATYRVVYLNVLNGSKGTLPQIGEIDAWHLLQAIAVRARVPVVRHFGIGGDWTYYLRKSHFQNPNLADVVEQNVRILRLYATWEVGRGIGD